MTGFFEFIRKQGVVGLAVAFILGLAINDLVKSLIDNIINPLLGILLGKAEGLTSAKVMVMGAQVSYGAFLNTFINFLVIAFVIYFIVKGLGFERLDKKEEEKPAV